MGLVAAPGVTESRCMILPEGSDLALVAVVGGGLKWALLFRREIQSLRLDAKIAVRSGRADRGAPGRCSRIW